MIAENNNHQPSMFDAFTGIMRRELLLAWKKPGDALNPLFFFLMVCTLFPLAANSSAENLQLNGPGILWVAALLATLLSLNSMFVSDYEDGSLDQILISLQPLPLLVLGKIFSHWLISGLPLVLISPFLAMTYKMSSDIYGLLMTTLMMGTICLSFLGSIGAALTVGLNRGNTLLSLLILPLAMPILVFGANTVSLAAKNEFYTTGIWALAAYAVAALSLIPYITAAALRISNE